MLLALLTTVAATFATGEELFRPLTYDAALAAAKGEQRVVMIDFFTTWCAPCKRLDATTWKDPAVLAWARETLVAIKLDAEQNVELAQRYKIDAYPTMVFLRADGTEIERVNGFKEAPAFLTEAKDLLAGKDAISRLREKLAGREKDCMLRGELADALARRGHHEEALAEYLRCFDEGRDASGYGGVRLSFLLSDIKRLGAVYPPALRALEERRDAAGERVLAVPVEAKQKGRAMIDTSNDVFEFVALNSELDTPERTLALFERLLERGRPPLHVRAAFLPHVLDPLRTARRYADLLLLVDKPAGYVRDALKRDAMLESFAQPEEPATEEEREAEAARRERRRQRSVMECCAFVEALLATPARRDEGLSVVEQVLAFAPTLDTHKQLVWTAARAGAPDVARGLITRGVAAIAGSQSDSVQRTLEDALLQGERAIEGVVPLAPREPASK